MIVNVKNILNGETVFLPERQAYGKTSSSLPSIPAPDFVKMDQDNADNP
jgi:hypothetical protein